MADACYWWEANKHRWQDDLPGYIFLPRAFHQIAEHLCKTVYKTVWTGKEPEAFVSVDYLAWSELELPDVKNEVLANSHHRKLAERLLQRRNPDFVAERHGHPANYPLDENYIVLSSSQWAGAREIWHMLRAHEQLFENVKQSMIESLRKGVLVAALQPYDSPTQMLECERELWWPNGADQRVRFYYCRLNPKGPEIDRDTDGTPYCWIYITQNSLRQFLGKKRGRSPGLSMPNDDVVLKKAIKLMSSGGASNPTIAVRLALKSVKDAGAKIFSEDTAVSRIVKHMPSTRKK